MNGPRICIQPCTAPPATPVRTVPRAARPHLRHPAEREPARVGGTHISLQWTEKIWLGSDVDCTGDEEASPGVKQLAPSPSSPPPEAWEPQSIRQICDRPSPQPDCGSR